jgi:glycosyltransferase involved in cell wall biosynthesis
MRIAFFTLNAYDMLTGGFGGDSVGGAQLQQILIGKELDDRGHDVYFVEYDGENKTEQTIDGIQVLTKSAPAGSEVQRAYTVVRGTRQILNRVNPDVCYRRSLDFEILPLSFYSTAGDSRFVYGIAHDDELSGTPHKFSTGVKSTAPYKWLNQKCLSTANAVIAQNPTQYDIAINRLSTTVYQIPNCYVTDESEPIEWEYESPVVFWAARFEPWKRPDVVAKLAEALPEITFVMAGGPGEKEIVSSLKKRAAEINNLHLLGHVPFSEIDRYFAAADLFLNTSETEGFPNTFLQAWANRTPVVSLQVDPDDILTGEEIGKVADGSLNILQSQIEELSTDREQREKLADKSSTYLENNHTVQTVTNQYEHVFQSC